MTQQPCDTHPTSASKAAKESHDSGASFWRRAAAMCSVGAFTVASLTGLQLANAGSAAAQTSAPPGSCYEGDRATAQRIADMTVGTTVSEHSATSYSVGLPAGVQMGMEYTDKMVYEDTAGPPTIVETRRSFFGEDDGSYTLKVRYSPDFQCGWAWMGDVGGRQDARFWIDRSDRANPNTGWVGKLGDRAYPVSKTNTYGGVFNLPQEGDWSMRACAQLDGDPRYFCTLWLAPTS